jgi:hypothetical protein
MNKVLLSLWVTMISVPALGGDPLVAPAYPGAEPIDAALLDVGSLEFGGRPEQRAYFLVRDNLDAVTDFYAQKDIAPGEPKRSRLGGVAADLYFVKLLDQSETLKQLKDYTLARPAGIQMLVPRAREEGIYLGALKDSVAKGQHSQQELDQVAARYAHLESCVFPPMQDEDGSWMPADQVLAGRYYSGMQQGFAAAAVDMDEIAARIQSLIAEGRMDEVAALSEQMAASMDTMGDVATADSWDQGIELLDELEQLAYRVVLIIDRQPETWSAP